MFLLLLSIALLPAWFESYLLSISSVIAAVHAEPEVGGVFWSPASCPDREVSPGLQQPFGPAGAAQSRRQD